jgi:purine-binding chemotaxis protein CheW
MSQAESLVTEGQYLTFFVGAEEYAIDVLRVREVVDGVAITRVPAAPRDVRGVANLRGSVVPVLDLGLRFGGGALVPTARTCVVVVECEGGADPLVGLLVDSVHRVVALTTKQIEPVPAFGTQARVELLSGIGVVDASFVQILAPDRVSRIQDEVDRPAS